MNCVHIEHPELEPIEYFYCYFSSNKDISDFAITCDWFDPEAVTLTPPEYTIIEHNKELGYFEKINPAWFKRKIGARVEVLSAVLHNAQSFFR